MITNKDLEIQNISYTNKDFGQIYPELVDLAKNITDKWDPEDTNESDPGIVLLKMAAFLGDKLNYNIDKNTLEQFITSATQESSMRKLTEMLGYNMKYYNSATTNVSFRYLGEMGKTLAEGEETDDKISTLQKFTIKAFDTKFETDDNVIYTLLEDIPVDINARFVGGKLAIQGEVKDLTVLGSDNYTDSNLIQLYNLDDQNRVYFPDVEVAENGIFIDRQVANSLDTADGLKTIWHRVDNLNDQDLGSKVFKFGFDSSKGFPYIEFPSDISDLIGEGLQVSYIVSNGASGKVLNGKLTKIASTKIIDENGAQITTTLTDDVYALSNTSSVSGNNPETITEAYNNFKKTIGTFNTLVSCRDYSNYLNTFVDNANDRLVSNVYATDVRTDPDYSTTIFTRDNSSLSYYKREMSSKISLHPEYRYNLVLHGTQPYNLTINSLSAYNKTYEDLTDANISYISAALDDVKTVSHTLITPADDTLNFIEADYTLKANISTKYKVNTTEQKEIINNIKQSLYENFNATKVDFGEEIPYDSLVDCIKNADTRIKNINLDDPIINYYIRKQNTDKKELYAPVVGNTLSTYVERNILAGALPVYGDTGEFNYDYLYTYDSPVKNLAGIDCRLDISKDLLNEGYKLKENESIQVVSDSYKTDLIYPSGVYYAFYSNSAAGKVVVNKDQIYTLRDNEALYLQYTDSSDVTKLVTYKKGTIIKPNFDIVNTNGIAEITDPSISVEYKTASKFWSKTTNRAADMKYTEYDGKPEEIKNNLIPLFGIGTKEEIDIVAKNEVTLPKFSNCFWYIKPRIVDNKITNEEGNLILSVNPYNDKEYQYILEEGEYFIYPNDDATSLNILEAGTKIVCAKASGETGDTKTIQRSNGIDVVPLSTLENAIEDADIGTFKKAFSWEQPGVELRLIETVMSNFVDSTIKIGGDVSLDKTWIKCPATITVDGAENRFTSGENDTSTQPLIRTVLSILCSKDEPQKILTGQTVSYLYSDVPEETEQLSTTEVEKLAEGTIIQTSTTIDSYNDLAVLQMLRYGVDGDEFKVIKDSDGKFLHNFPYSLLTYKENTSPAVGTLDRLLKDLKENGRNISTNARGEYVIFPADLEKYLGKAAKTLTIAQALKGCYYNIFDTVDTRLEKGTGEDIIIDVADIITTSKRTLYIAKPQKLSLYNYLVDANISEGAINKILEGNPTFDVLGTRNNSKLISSYAPLYSFFDTNNIYNKFTLPKIDFESSEFNIVGSSKL